MTNQELFNEDHETTYCPEDDKIRLYVGRVPKEEYLALRSEGWKATPKQDCDFVAVWTVAREDTALSYAGIILDEDQSPTDRAADRAERFGGYLDKRREEAHGHADKYDAGPQVHGYQSAAKAVRAADRHDRQADRACDAWSKAEYWQRRTAGVIGNALHKQTPGCRMGRLKKLESSLRYIMSEQEKNNTIRDIFVKFAANPDTEKGNEHALFIAGNRLAYGGPSIKHPRTGEFSSIHDQMTDKSDPMNVQEVADIMARGFADGRKGRNQKHLELRIGYENQMLESVGGRAANVEMVVGGWIGSHQIHKVNKSSASGQVVSVTVKGRNYSARFDRDGKAYNDADNLRPVVDCLYNVERLEAGAYRPPEPGDVEKIKAFKKLEKAARPKKPSLINPTKKAAEIMQGIINAESKAQRPSYKTDFVPSEVAEMTQEQYKGVSGNYGRAKTVWIGSDGLPTYVQYRGNVETGAVCKVRITSCDDYYRPKRVIVLTDKPQKAFPAFAPIKTEAEKVAK